MSRLTFRKAKDMRHRVTQSTFFFIHLEQFSVAIFNLITNYVMSRSVFMIVGDAQRQPMILLHPTIVCVWNVPEPLPEAKESSSD